MILYEKIKRITVMIVKIINKTKKNEETIVR